MAHHIVPDLRPALAEDPALRALGEVVRAKLADAEIPGVKIDFDPDEAEVAGAFREEALSLEEARAAEDGFGDYTPVGAV